MTSRIMHAAAAVALAVVYLRAVAKLRKRRQAAIWEEAAR
jgi:hypothetical protein